MSIEEKTMNPIVHFEIPYDDEEKAKEFYSIFGWELRDIPGMDYIGATTTPVDENRMPKQPGAINSSFNDPGFSNLIIAFSVRRSFISSI